MKPKSKQINWTLALGNDATGRSRLELYRTAAKKVMQGDPKLLSAWMRSVLDAEADRILDENKLED